jgi:hypothetical protein
MGFRELPKGNNKLGYLSLTNYEGRVQLQTGNTGFKTLGKGDLYKSLLGKPNSDFTIITGESAKDAALLSVYTTPKEGNKFFLKVDRNTCLSGKTDANSQATVFVTQGKVWTDQEPKILNRAQDVIDFICDKSISKSTIKALVTSFGTPSLNNDGLANKCIGAVAAKSAGLSVLAGAGGGITAIALGAAEMVASWGFQAEIAYAVGVSYGIYPGSDGSFKKDFANIVAGGPAELAASLKSDGKALVKGAASTALQNAGNKIGKKFLKDNSLDGITDILITKLATKFAGAVGKEVAGAALKFVPFIGGVYEAIASAYDATRLGTTAKDYFKY